MNTSSFPFIADTGHLIGASLATTNLSVGQGGFIGGGQIVYNYQVNERVLLGFEADFQGIGGGKGSTSKYSGISFADPIDAFSFLGPLPSSALNGVTASSSLDYLGTARGRVGFLITPGLMVFGTGGLAYGGANVNVTNLQLGSYSYNGTVIAISSVPGNSQFSNNLVGWTAGGGVEWMFMTNWSAKVEYLYYNLGSVSDHQNSILYSNVYAPYNVAYSTASTSFNGNIVRAGVNYHFNFANAAPVVTKF